MSKGLMHGIAPAWALLGVAGLFTSAVFRLGSRGLATVRAGLSPGQWVVLVSFTLVMVYGEGVLALQRKWVPRLLGRARALRHEPWGLKLLAPLYGLSLVGGTRKELLRGWLGTSAIITAIVLVRAMPEPWRGIVDFAVASALAWGLLSIALGSPKVFRSTEAEPSTEPVPGAGHSRGQAHAPE